MKKYILAHPWLLALAVLFGAATQGLNVLAQLLIGNIVDAMVSGDSNTFFSYIGVAVVVVILTGLLVSVSVRMFMAYAFKSQRTLHKDFFDNILGTKISDFNQGNSATYISVLNNDIKNIAERYFSAVPQFSQDFLAVIMAIVAMATISPINALIAIFTAFLPLIGPIVLSRRLSKTQMEVSIRAVLFNQKVKDYLTGFEVIKTFGVEENIKPRFFGVANKLMRALHRGGSAMADVGALTATIVMSVLFVNYFVAGYFVLRGDITVGGVAAIIALSTSILQPMTHVTSHISSIRSTKEISMRVLDMMKQKDITTRDVKIDTFENNIEFKNVNFAYETEGKEDALVKTLALKDVTYSFKKGGKYAIVGPSGSGKSTIAKLIIGYYDNYEGDILINKSNIRDIDRESLYKVISTLHQNVFMLDDTLRNNITLYNDYSNEEYEAALQKANLLAVEAALANGSDTLLGEGGNTISGGERQRVSIARAILKGSEVMILDEATASLDNIVAHDIEKTIIGMEDLTCIFVTHRYSREVLEQCDGILVMKDGALFEQGTYKELYENKGYFFSLLNIMG